MNKKSLLAVITLAIFNFCFLGTEYLFDNMMALVTDSTEVVNAQNLVLGVSVLGFVAYGFLHKYLPEKVGRLLTLLATVISVSCVFVIEQHSSRASIYIAGIICFICMGIAGSAVCYLASRSIDNYENLGKYVGLSYALGILIQYCNNNWVKSDLVESITISVFMVIFVCGTYLLSSHCNNFKENTNDDSNEYVSLRLKRPVVSLVSLSVCVFLMTLIFSTLDNAVTLVHSSGEYNIGQWPRLLLAVSGLVAGFVYDIKKRIFMPAIMYVVTMLSVISIIVIQLSGSFIFGLMVFYISAGFFVVFFMVSFMDLSHYTKMPRIWAGMGRAINNLCAIVSTALTVSMLNNGSIMMTLIVAIVLLAGITCSIVVYYMPFVEAIIDMDREVVKKEALEEFSCKSKSDKFQMFVLKHAFTERETEVMLELINNDDSVSNISKKLAMSRANLYRHVAKINEKTNTESRAELIRYYHEWNDDIV